MMFPTAYKSMGNSYAAYLIFTSLVWISGCTPEANNAAEANNASDANNAKETASIQFVTSESNQQNGYPFSDLVEVDNWLFLSGAVGTIPGGGLVEGGIEAESRQTMENIKALLETQGLGMEHLVKCTAMLADMAEWPAFNLVYKTFFNGTYPARSAFGASGLALNARIEIECIAHR